MSEPTQPDIERCSIEEIQTYIDKGGDPFELSRRYLPKDENGGKILARNLEFIAPKELEEWIKILVVYLRDRSGW
jgi:hypothetical protein